MVKLLALTQGMSVPSTRFRWGQYVDDFIGAGFSVTEKTARFGAYAPDGTALRRIGWASAAIADAILRVGLSRGYDVYFLQRNLVATLNTAECMIRQPFVFDVDDAIFLTARRHSADRIAAQANLVVCGNSFLAEYFSAFSPVVVRPTAVDDERFVPVLADYSRSGIKYIGWSGSSGGYKYLYDIEEAIQVILERFEDVRLLVVADRPPVFRKIDKRKVRFELWSPEREVELLQLMNVGLMPLEDSLWARGKCSFKMLTYMSVGVPVVVSPVGMNVEVFGCGDVGYLAVSKDDWVDAISSLLDNSCDAVRKGENGRQVVQKYYSRRVIAPQLVKDVMSIL